jgi:hypothetical protein
MKPRAKEHKLSVQFSHLEKYIDIKSILSLNRLELLSVELINTEQLNPTKRQ